MKLIKFFFILLLISSLPDYVYAEMYVWTDENGTQHYSDTQPNEAISPAAVKEVPEVETVWPDSHDKRYSYEDCNRGGACYASTFKCDSEIQDLIHEKDYPFIEAMIKENPGVVNLYECEVSPLLTSTAWGRQKISQLLIEKGADVNFKHATYGFTPLHQAIMQLSIDTIKLLIQNGADVNAVTSRSKRYKCIMAPLGSTPLHWAVFYMSSPTSECHSDTLEIVKILIENGANPLLKDAFGDTPLGIAEKRGDLALIENIYKELGMKMPAR